MPDGGRLISYQDGATAAVSVVEDAAGVRRLRIDNRQQEGSSASGVADARQAFLPLLLHPAPQRALFLGLGTGVTASAAAEDSTVQVDVAELLPEVIRAAAYFTPGAGGAAPDPALNPGPPPGWRAVTADARRFVRAAGPAYDVIVADNVHPARSGTGALYTVQHFQAVRARLAAGGVFCQWLPLHQLDLDTLRSIVQSFRAVYPGGWAMLATHSLDTPVLGLVARLGHRPGTAADSVADATRFNLGQLRQRVAGSALAPRLADVGLADEWALLGGFVAGPSALAQFAGAAPPNTDDRPVVAYRAPRITYAPDSAPRDRLLALLGQLKIDPAELVATVEPAKPVGPVEPVEPVGPVKPAEPIAPAEPGPEPGPAAAEPQRLAAYWAARDAFIAAGHGVRPSANAQAMLAQVQAPLLRVLHISPDFRPAYDPLLRLALALGRTDPAGARALLAALVLAQPARPEAAAALGQLLPAH